MSSILIVEDEALLRRQLSGALKSAGHEVRETETGREALDEVRRDPPDLVLLDLRLPDQSGLDVLGELMTHDASQPVVLMTAHGSVRDAVEAMRLGARDYLQKPLDLDELRLLIDRVLAQERRNRELAYLRDRDRVSPDGVVGRDRAIVSFFAQVERLRGAEIPPAERPTILLTGETGTGKGVIARAVHDLLGGGTFIEVNCTAMPASLFEAELFGHERGTFTDAKTARTGLFEAAHGGTLFLDEIGHLELALQAKLLKAIDEKRIRRLGSNRDRHVDVHVIAATNRDLDAAVREQTFRPDLLHRLGVLTFEVPPLRERKDDLLDLARHFADEFGHKYGARPRSIAPDAESALLDYPWPGNVRELRNVIERAVLLEAGEELGSETLAGVLQGARAREAPSGADSAAASVTLPASGLDLADVERDLIRQALARAGGNRTRAAALLGLSRDTLRYRMEKFGLR